MNNSPFILTTQNARSAIYFYEARAIYEALGIAQHFPQWFNYKCKQHNMKEIASYYYVPQNKTPTQEFIISEEFAKKILAKGNSKKIEHAQLARYQVSGGKVSIAQRYEIKDYASFTITYHRLEQVSHLFKPLTDHQLAKGHYKDIRTEFLLFIAPYKEQIIKDMQSHEKLYKYKLTKFDIDFTITIKDEYF